MATTELPKIIAESLYYEQAAQHRRRLVVPVEVPLSNGDYLYIPAGYITDGASCPRLLWGIISPYGRHDLATLVHDFLLSDTSYSREFADREFLYWLKVSSVSRVKRTLMYAAVRSWSNYKNLKATR